MDGNTDRYAHNPDDTFSPPPAVYRTLVHNVSGTYTATELDNSSWTFDSTGNLTSITDRFGNSSTLGYNGLGELISVSDPAGRGSLSLAYTNGLLTSVTDWASPARTESYQYDANGRLWKVTDRENQTTTFGYDGTSQRLTTISDALGHVAVTMTYDAQGRVLTQKDAKGLITGATTTFGYVVNGDGTRVTTVTYPPTSFEPSFSPTVIDSYTAQGWLVGRVSHPSTTETLTETYAYDATGNQTSVTDARGFTTDFCYDVDYAGTAIAGSRGNLTRRIDPAPTAGANRPTTLFAYDAKNNPLQVVAPKGVPAGSTVTCSTNLSAITAASATDMTYDATGALLLSSTSRFTDPDTGLKTATTKFEYGDAANPGLVTRVIPPRGNTGGSPDYSYATTLSYGTTGTGAGQLIAATDALGNTTTYEYDAAGRRIKVVDPLRNAAGGVPAEHATESVYDNEDRVRFHKAPAPQAGGSQLVTEARYDAVGNRIVGIDANGQVTTYAYDERDGLFQVKESPLVWTDPASPPATVITTEYGYDNAGNLTRMTRAKSDAANERVTDYTFDGRDLVRREAQYPSWPTTSPTLVTTSAYDPNGNPTTLLDPLGQTTTSSYDRLNRLVGIDYSSAGTPDVSYAYDANGNRTSMTDGTGTSTYAYDEANRLTSVTSPGPKTVGYRYDLDGNRTKLIYPDATAVTYTFNKASQLASLLDWASRSVGYTYWPDGALKTATNPDASVATYGYDNARRATDILDQKGSTTIGHYAYSLDAVGNVTGLADGVAPATQSVSSVTVQANGANNSPSTSADGRYVVFSSAASNLVEGDTNAVTDIFMGDLQMGTTSRVSISTAGTQATGASSNPSTSSDGRYVAFASDANNIVSGDTNGTTDVFVRDSQAGTTIRVSVATAGTQATGASTEPTISADGRYVAFSSMAANLVSGDTNGVQDVFMRDLQAATTIRLSVATAGTQATGASSAPSMSGDGHVVAFSSTATNLVAGDTNAAADVFSRNLQAATTSRVSVTSAGAQGTGTSGDPAVNADGRYIAFSSLASNFDHSSAGAQDVYLRDLQAATTTRVSVSGTEAPEGPGPLVPVTSAAAPAINADGRYVAFEYGNVVQVRDMQSPTPSLVSVGSNGAAADASSFAPSISGVGSVVAFASDATNLVAGDVNGMRDVFARSWSSSVQQSVYGYDRLSRLTAASGPDGSRTYTYDPAGNRATVNSGGTTTYNYDRGDRLQSQQGPPTAGASTRVPSTNDAGWSSGSNAYASDNQYATATPAKNATTSLKVGTFGFDSTVPASATITGVTVTVEWKVSTNQSNATLGAQAWVNGAAYGSELVDTAEPLSDFTHTFSVPGLTRAQLLNGALQIRIRATRGSSNSAVTASLDAVSVRVDYTTPGSLTLTTDANGNLVAKGPSTFAYDGANRLTSATVAGVGETYAYDGDGVRFSRTVGAGPVIRYVSDVTSGLPVTIDDGTRTYVYGLGPAYAVSGSTLEIYHTDRLGSVRALTDAAGTVNTSYRTDEYGVPVASTGSSMQPFAYTGEPRDASGLIYLRARYYDPTLGRFLSRDTWAGDARIPGSLARYAYVENKPTSFGDPSGRIGPAVGVACFASGVCEEAIGFGLGLGTAAVAAAGTWFGATWLGQQLFGTSSSVIDQRTGGTIPPIRDRWRVRNENDLRPAHELIIPLGGGLVELGYGTPGGGNEIPGLCRALHLNLKQCIATGLVVGAGSLIYFAHENDEHVSRNEDTHESGGVQGPVTRNPSRSDA